MGNKPSKEISRRDAIKILAAVAGATALVNLPDKWTKPGMEVGVLPAHAQTSLASIVAGPSLVAGGCRSTVTSTATISPPRLGVVLRYNITVGGGVSVSVPLTDTRTTDAGGVATLLMDIAFGAGDPVIVTWTFENPADGSGSAAQVFSYPGAC